MLKTPNWGNVWTSAQITSRIIGVPPLRMTRRWKKCRLMFTSSSLHSRNGALQTVLNFLIQLLFVWFFQFGYMICWFIHIVEKRQATKTRSIFESYEELEWILSRLCESAFWAHGKITHILNGMHDHRKCIHTVYRTAVDRFVIRVSDTLQKRKLQIRCTEEGCFRPKALRKRLSVKVW